MVRFYRNLLLGFLSLCLAVSVICLAFVPKMTARGENIVVPDFLNSGFEDGMSGWILWTADNGISGQPAAAFSVVQGDEAYSGKSLSVLHTATNTGVRAVIELKDMAAVSPSSTYEISYQFRSESSSVAIVPCVMQYDSKGKETSANSSVWLTDYRSGGITNGWEEMSFSFTTAQDAAYIRFKLDLEPTGPSAVYFDDFTASVVDKSMLERFNGGLEAAEEGAYPEGWYIREKSTVSADFKVYAEGKNSLHIKRDNYLSDFTMRSEGRVAVESGKQYRFSYLIRSANCNFSAAIIKVTVYDGVGNVVAEVTSGETILNTGKNVSDWQEIFVLKNMPSGAATAVVSITISKGIADCWIDDVQARENNPVSEDFDKITSDGVPVGWSTSGNVAFRGGLMSLAGESEAKMRWDVYSSCIYELSFNYITAGKADAQAVVTLYSYAGKEKKSYVFDLGQSASEKRAVYSFSVDSGEYAELSFRTSAGEIAVDDVRIILIYDPRTAGTGWQGAWVCYPASDIAYGMEDSKLYYRYTFELEETGIEKAVLQFTADDMWQFWINGTQITDEANNGSESWAKVSVLDMTSYLHSGENILAFEVTNVTYYTGLIFDMTVLYDTGKEDRFISGADVLSALEKDITDGWILAEYDDSGWRNAYVMGVPPVNPWGNVAYTQSTTLADSMQIKEYALDETIVPGEYGTVRMTVNTPAPIGSDLQFKIYFWGKYSSDNFVERVPSSVLELVSGLPSSEWPAGQDVELVYKFLVPDYLEEGSYMLQIDPAQILVTGNDFYTENKLRGTYFRAEAVEKQLVKSEISDKEGTTALYINGERTAPFMYLREQTTVFKESYASGMEGAGVQLIGLPNARSYEMNKAGSMWLADGYYDFSPLDDVIYETLAGAPNALLMLSMDANPPVWWLEENPDECVVDSSGKVYTAENGVSYASEKWRKDVAEYYKAYIDYVLKQPYASHIFGIKISAGVTFEWQHYGMSLSTCGDFSPAAVNAFREWLKEKYGSDEALQQAWGDSSVTLQTAAVPSWSDRTGKDYTYLLDGISQRDVIDYHYFYSDMVTDSLLYFADVVKTASNRQWIVGTYNGYMLNSLTFESNGIVNTSVERILTSEDVDFLCSPMLYDSRMHGMSASFMGMVDSVINAGKLYFLELDSRTVFYQADDMSPALLQEWGKTYSLRDTIELMKRDFASVLAKGAGLWWYDMNGGWFDDSEIYDLISAMKKEAEFSVAYPTESTADIAWVVDDDLIATTPYHFDGTYSVLYYANYLQKEELVHVGAPHDMLYLSDLERGVARQYKVYLISAVDIDEKEAEALEKIKKDGAVIIWYGLPGVYDTNGTLSEERMSRITGIDLRLTSQALPYSVNIDAQSDSAFTKGAEGTRFGKLTTDVRGIVTPMAYVEDAGAAALGMLGDSGYVGFASKEMQDWTSIFSSVACIPAQVIRNALVQAGGHLYCADPEGDALFINSGYVGINSPFGGERTIVLSAACDVYDVFAGEYVAKNTDTFTVEMEAGTTRLFKTVAPGAAVSLPEKEDPLPQPSPDPSGEEPSDWRIVAFVVGGLVLIVAAGGVVAAVMAKKRASKTK